MAQEITEHYAKKAQKEAEWAYNKAKEKFYYSMLEVVFLRIKSHLSAQGIKKVMEMDERRNSNENLSVEFSQKTWAILEESWIGAEFLAMTKIADLYRLEIVDLDISKIKKLNEKRSNPTCESTTEK